MRFHLTLLLLSLVTFACQQDKPATPVAPPVTVAFQEYKFEKCVKDSVCARINASWPVLSGGTNAAAIKAINDSLQLYAGAGMMSNHQMPLEKALDSTSLELYALLETDLKERPDWTSSYEQELTSQKVLQNSKIVSFNINASGFTGGAHGYYASAFSTFELTTGKELMLTDIISDTIALRPMLEKAFVDEKKADMPDATLKDLLLNPDAPLALPVNVCIVQDGVSFFYNPYEVASWAVGPTAITLTWDQLGALADRKKWIE